MSTHFLANGVSGVEERVLGDVANVAADGNVQRKDYEIAFSLVLCMTQTLERHGP